MLAKSKRKFVLWQTLFSGGKIFTPYRFLLPAPTRYIDSPCWNYRCSTLRIYIRHGGDISPPRPAYRYLSQGVSLDNRLILILYKITL
ncbi:hypothetical protein EV202_11433 [Bacteroides heparinolyticus]|uniref:Uncharacterized protein n=1 Tax=Prevotella heparinolytica TaxID=28113 RepID=A0A4R2LVV5_9BACE|nr:hypothetical protein EV202_11433 [Bacteroides heparinolyticus]